jgi:dGTPase
LERLGLASVDQVRDHPARIITFPPDVEQQKNLLKEYLYRNLYSHPAILPEKEQGVRIIEDLFQFYLDHPDRLPRSYADRVRRGPAHRVICDYIAGMTDPFIQNLYAEMLGAGRARTVKQAIP